MTRYFVTLRSPRGIEQTNDFNSMIGQQLWIIGWMAQGCTVIREWVGRDDA